MQIHREQPESRERTWTRSFEFGGWNGHTVSDNSVAQLQPKEFDYRVRIGSHSGRRRKVLSGQRSRYAHRVQTLRVPGRIQSLKFIIS